MRKKININNLFMVPYTLKTNSIEIWFNKIKHSLKLKKIEDVLCYKFFI